MIGLLVLGSSSAWSGESKSLERIATAGSTAVLIPPTYSIEAEMPEVPESLQVFATAHYDPESCVETSDLNEVLGIVESRRVHRDNGPGASSVIILDAANQSIEYFSSGGVLSVNGDLFSESNPDLVAGLGMDESTAQQYLGERASELVSTYGLARDGLSLERVSFATVEIVDATTHETVEKRVTGATAHFGLQINGIPAWGPGAKVNVFFGPGGRVDGFFDAIRDLTPSGQAEIVDPSVALERYVAYGTPKTTLRTGISRVDEIVIEGIELVYHLEAANVRQDEVRPKYLITGHFVGIDAKEEPVEVPFRWLEPAT
jgi:hypothetical protein